MANISRAKPTHTVTLKYAVAVTGATPSQVENMVRSAMLRPHKTSRGVGDDRRFAVADLYLIAYARALLLLGVRGEQLRTQVHTLATSECWPALLGKTTRARYAIAWLFAHEPDERGEMKYVPSLGQIDDVSFQKLLEHAPHRQAHVIHVGRLFDAVDDGLQAVLDAAENAAAKHAAPAREERANG